MEGGGARGTAYLGAVKELENQLKELVKNNPLDYKMAFVHPDRVGGPGIMDFLKKDYDDDCEFKPIIQGLSGSSAGAITTFAITLGLNSTEIEQVLNYEFKNFLNDTDHGKYRMIDNSSLLKVGMNKGDLLGGKTEVYDYDLRKNKASINKNTGLIILRKYVISLIFKVIGDGLASNVDQLLNMFSKNKTNDLWSNKLQQLFTKNIKIGGKAVKYGVSQAFNWALSEMFFKHLRKKTGMNLKVESVLALYYDNGAFSGFQVREFFYDLLLFAATRDTYFQKMMLNYYSENKIGGKLKDSNIKDLFKSYTNYSRKNYENCSPLPGTVEETIEVLTNVNKDSKWYLNNFEIGKRAESFKENASKTDSIYTILTHLQTITFRELWEITGIEFAVGASNFTAGKPLYFSDIYTPHFRVLEAVASSMTIPPIKPVLNASNVYIKNFKKGDGHKIPSNFKEDTGTLENLKVLFHDKEVLLKENILAYNFYELLVKKLLQEELSKDNELGNPYVDTNNGIELHTFLPKLMQLVIGDKYDENKKLKEERGPNSRKVNDVELNNKIYNISNEVLQFYYNAQFKGLFIDGGYYNNIPFNYFRDSILKTIDGVLAIKLDNNFPIDFILELNNKYEKYLIKIKNIEEQVEEQLYGKNLKDYNYETTKQANAIIEDKLNEEFELLIDLVRGEFIKTNNTSKVDKNQLPDRKAILKLIKQMAETYRNNKETIWLREKKIFAIALEGYSFGAERAQVRTVNDNDHIIPLYGYGVGTFDFDLKKVEPMAKLSQDKAEVHIRSYFETKKQ